MTYSLLKYACTLSGSSEGKVSRHDIIKRFGHTWQKISLDLLQLVMNVCSVDLNAVSLVKLRFFVENYESYVKLNNNHYNDSDQFKVYSGLKGFYDETPRNNSTNKKMAILMERLQEKFMRITNAFLFFDKDHVNKLQNFSINSNRTPKFI